jgi:hypothetical protein
MLDSALLARPSIQTLIDRHILRFEDHVTVYSLEMDDEEERKGSNAWKELSPEELVFA